MEAIADIDIKELILRSIEDSLSSQEYNDLLQAYAGEGKTTGSGQNEDLIYYTRLNAQRSKRIAKTVTLNEQLKEKIMSIEGKQTWVLITESWCGDAANSVPVIAGLAQHNPDIDLRIVLRDSHTELMDQFLTSGGRSIPKLIALNEEWEVLFTWGPRPEEAQDMYTRWKNSENKPTYKEFQVELQKWYNNDKGGSLQAELNALL